MKFYCIGDADTVRGFRLAGVEGRAVTSAEEAVAALEHAMNADHGIVVLTQPAADWMRERVEAFRGGRDLPLVVEIPGPEGPLTGRKTMRQLVQSAVGVRVDVGKGG